MELINFACRKISIEQAIRCGLGVNRTEYKILKFLLSKNNEIDIESISKSIKKDRTTTQRAIKKLHSIGVILRRQANLPEGGFRFYYSVKDKEALRQKAHKNLCGWNKLIETELKNW